MRFRSLLAVPAILFAAQSLRAQDAPAPSQNDLDKAALIQMKSDLRNLVTAQEAFYADHSAYAGEMEGLKFKPSVNVSIRLTATQNNAWAAEARSTLLPNVACVIWINLAEQYRPRVGGVLLPNREGEPACAEIRKP